MNEREAPASSSSEDGAPAPRHRVQGADSQPAADDGPTARSARVAVDDRAAGSDSGIDSHPDPDPDDAVTSTIPVTPSSAVASPLDVGDGTDPTPGRPRWNRWELLAWSAPLFVIVIAFQGLLPGSGPPALIWSLGAGNIECVAGLGWSQFVERCQQIGAPFGSPLLLGLPQTYLGAWLSYLPGIDAWRAYKIVTALCCAVGFAGFVALFRRWNAPVWLAALGAGLYLSSPTLISLTNFTFTFHGYAQLPAYLWLLLRSLDGFAAGRRLQPALIAVGTCLLVVFTDGYSFIGTAVLVLIVGLGWVLSRQLPWRIRLTGLACWAVAMLGSAGLYLVYIPSGGVDLRVGIGAFRYLGLDVITLFLPGPSIWYAGASPWRSTLLNLWGDGSNQTSNFLGYVAVALVVLALVFGLLRPRTAGGRERFTLAVAGLACLVLSFGPALKVGDAETAISPTWNVPLDQTTMWLPTSLLYEHVPGFTEIRATYRIFAVTRFALVALAIVGLVALWRTRAKWLAPVLAVLLVLEASVDPIRQLHGTQSSYDLTAGLRSGLLIDLQTLVRPGETMLMLPASNDFLATALVPFTGATSYNVGVDKNYYLSTARWPAMVKNTVARYSRGDISAVGCQLLRTGTADVIVLPFVPLGAGVRTASPIPALQSKAESVAAAGATAGVFTVARTGTALSLRAGPACS